MSTDSRPISRPILGRYIGRNSADISIDINRSVMEENDEVLGPAGEGRDDVKFFDVNYICFQLSTLFTI